MVGSQMKKISFVILHYITINDTNKCVQSIRNNIDTTNYSIVIVDNGSTNNSGEVLKEMYANEENIYVITNEGNLGFANGNNIGITFSREKLKADFVCCLNSDTEIMDCDFYSKVMSEYDENYTAVIGPQILDKNKKEYKYRQNIKTCEEYIKELEEYSKLSFVYSKALKSYLRNFSIKTGFLKKFYSRRDIAIYKDIVMPQCRTENVKLHGCCLVFTPLFFSKLYGFDNRTFLYREEELLYLNLKKNGLKSVYLPNISIIHYEDGATNSILPTPFKKWKFVQEQQEKSLVVLIKTIQACDWLKQ